MFSNFKLFQAYPKWALKILGLAFIAWYALAYAHRQDEIDWGMTKTRELLVWLGNAVELIPFVGSAFSEFILEQCSQLPAQINVNKLVVNIDDGALFKYWLAWVGLALAIWLLLGLVSVAAALLSSPGDFVAGWKSIRPAAPPAPAGGTAPTAAAATATTAATPVAPVVTTAAAPNEHSQAMLIMKLAFAVFIIFVLVIAALYLVPAALNMYLGTSFSPPLSGVFGDLWGGLTFVGKLIGVVGVIAVIVGLGLAAQEATNQTIRRNVPAGTPWRAIDTNHLASYFVVEVALVIGAIILFF